MLIVVREIVLYYETQVTLIEDEELVQTFLADASDPTLGIGVGVRGSNGHMDNGDAFCLKDSIKGW
jgi:hypothetical protein